jgi:hypothetical protein
MPEYESTTESTSGTIIRVQSPRAGPLYVHVWVPDGPYHTNTVQATKVLYETRTVRVTEYRTNPEWPITPKLRRHYPKIMAPVTVYS